MSKKVKLEPGQFYRSRGGEICFVVGKSAVFAGGDDCWVVEESHGATETFTEDGFFLSVRSEHHRDLVEHLPGCDGFDWEPPKPIDPPEGWRLLTIGETIKLGDMYLRANEWVAFEKADSTTVVNDDFNPEVHRPVARKIEPKYRPFKNAEEFKPHRDKWWKYKDAGFVFWPPACYSDEGYSDTDWDYCFENQVFEDGTPFGVEVTE